MNDLLIIAIVLALVIAGWFIVPYAIRQGWIKDGNLDGADNAIDIAKMILLVINVDDVTRNRTKFILDMADAAVSYVAGLSDPKADKKSLSIEVVNRVLKETGVTPSAQEQELIERLVVEVLALYDKQ